MYDVNINKLKTYFHSKTKIYTQTEAIEFIANYLTNEGYAPLNYLSPLSKNMPQAIKLIMGWFDIHLLPHIGLHPGSRHNKLRFLALLIR